MTVVLDTPPRPGNVVAGRFRLDRWVGAGGMGSVWLARDLDVGEPVALKLLGGAAADADAAARFAREARILASLDHPAVVRFIAFGTVPQAGGYLAMQWLDGEDLLTRLARDRLSVADALLLVTRLADGLAAVHRRGVVHRDLKPANVFLVDGDVARATLIDFGVGQVEGTHALTRAGAIVGTPGYMAPEQARGDPAGSAADVFALGCVFYEALAGRFAFRGESVMAVLAKVLLEPAPRLREVRPDAPSALDALLEQMLAKDPAVRLRDGAAVVDALARLPATTLGGPLTPRPVSIGRGEQTLVSVIAASPRSGIEHETGPTLDAADVGHQTAAVEHAARLHGCTVVRLADGTVLASLDRSGEALEQATRAVRAALAMRRAEPSRAIAVATGRARVSEALPLGEVIDRVAAGLRRPAVLAGRIGVDELTAGLVDLGFELVRDADGPLLVGELDPGGSARLLCGQPTSCVGRERELALLNGVWRECVDERVARVVVITAAAGVGKSRLRYELVRRYAGDAAVLLGRADPVSAGSPFGLLARAVARAAGLRDGDPLDTQRACLRAHVARINADDARRITVFLGELIGVPFDDDLVELRTARSDATLMGDQIRRAWVDYLTAQCAAGPVLLVLEDLHWGDLPTVNLVDAALRALPDAPLMVIALARPEVRERFPDLWAARDVLDLRLTLLPRRAAEALVREVMRELPAEAVTSIVERAGGIAFFLEELIRAAFEGRSGEPPPTAVAMAQVRVDALAEGARRVIRAASVFGEVFWAGAVASLVGVEDADSRAELDRQLDQLARAELVTRRPESRIAGDVELVFRHGLVREAAYAALTDTDRTLAHRLAADWLEAAGERDALVLAEHRSRGADASRAIPWYARAAQQALEGNDYPSALERVERARRAGAAGEPLGELELLAAEAHKWRGEWTAQATSGEHAMSCLAAGTPAWCQAAAAAAFGAGRAGDRALLGRLVDALREAPVIASPARVIALVFVGIEARYIVGAAVADELYELACAEGASIAAADPFVAATLHRGRAFRAYFDGDVIARVTACEAASAAYLAAGALRQACQERLNVGTALGDLGALDEGAAHLEAVLVEAERRGLASVTTYAMISLGMVRIAQGRLAEAAAPIVHAVERFVAEGNRRNETGARDALAIYLLATGDLEAAEREARLAVAIDVAPPLAAQAEATLARILLAAGRPDEALTIVESSAARAGFDVYRMAAHAEVLAAVGRLDDARAVAAAGLRRVDELAAKITVPSRRVGFLAQVPENARLRRLAASLDTTGSEP